MKELRSLSKTYLKANTNHSSLLSSAEKILIESDSVLIVHEVEDAGAYWRIKHITKDGEAIVEQQFALKAHWTFPTEVTTGGDVRAIAVRLFEEGKTVSEISKSLQTDYRRIKRWTSGQKKRPAF